MLERDAVSTLSNTFSWTVSPGTQQCSVATLALQMSKVTPRVHDDNVMSLRALLLQQQALRARFICTTALHHTITSSSSNGSGGVGKAGGAAVDSMRAGVGWSPRDPSGGQLRLDVVELIAGFFHNSTEEMWRCGK